MKPIIRIEEQLNKFFGNKKGLVKVSDILHNLDLSFLSKHIKHKHPTYSTESLIKLYLYKRVKGITTYPELIKDIDEKLGFVKLPSKRTFNEFIKKKINKFLLDELAELILKTATKNGVILDIKLVKETIQKRTKKDNKYKKQLRESTKLIKRLVYPLIDLKVHHNAVFTTKDLLDVLVHVAQNNDFANNGCTTFEELNPNKKVPNGDTLLYRLSKFESLEDIKLTFERIFDVIFRFAKKEYYLLKKRKVNLAIDVHKIPYYGNKNDDYVVEGKHERGTTHFFSFLTCSIVMAGKRFTIDAVPIHPFDDITNLLDRVIKRAKRKVHIDKIYLDRGFDKVKIINVLKQNKVRFIMPKIRSETVKAWFDKSEDCKARVITNFQIGVNPRATVNLVLVDDEDGIKRAFITNFKISNQIAHYLFNWYSKRWGIETSYRNMDKDFKPRTTSKNYHIRLFYFLFSVCLYNLWVLVNICIGILIYGKVQDKPIITAKMFAIVLYRVYLDYG